MILIGDHKNFVYPSDHFLCYCLLLIKQENIAQCRKVNKNKGKIPNPRQLEVNVLTKTKARFQILDNLK